jgi:hypothetical protein
MRRGAPYGTWREKLASKEINLPETLSGFTLELIQDLKDLRTGDITINDARARTQLAREVLRSIQLRLAGLKYMSEAAKAFPPTGGTDIPT